MTDFQFALTLAALLYGGLALLICFFRVANALDETNRKKARHHAREAVRAWAWPWYAARAFVQGLRDFSQLLRENAVEEKEEKTSRAVLEHDLVCAQRENKQLSAELDALRQEVRAANRGFRD